MRRSGLEIVLFAAATMACAASSTSDTGDGGPDGGSDNGPGSEGGGSGSEGGDDRGVDAGSRSDAGSDGGGAAASEGGNDGGPGGDGGTDGAPGGDAGAHDASSGDGNAGGREASTGGGPDGGGGKDAAVDGEATAVVAATPPMGWNSWNTFQCNMTETLIKGVADTFATNGMQAAGYQYVNLDDCWMDGRDSSGNLQWNATKFPSGIPALASYIHGKGLKFGIYETPNTVTCVGIYGGIAPSVAVGSLGHEAQDARTFASWGVDFLKYDLCEGNRASFTTMRDALRATGRPIVYSINPGNATAYPPDTPGWDPVSIANMWRIAYDINASYASVTSIIDQDAPFSRFAGPGHWNDADMLEVGKGMTADEDRSHFSMWAMLASPLLAGNDVRSMSTTSRDILTNAEVIAVSQDSLGHQAQLVATPQTNLQIWSRTLSASGARAVALLNRSAASASITVPWTSLGLSASGAAVRDLWAHADLGTFTGSYTATAIPPHGVAMLLVTTVP
jgi:alpha-galactosidase